MRLKELLRAMFYAYFVITTGIVASMYASCLLFNPDGHFSPVDIGGILLAALASDASFFIFYSKKELSKRRMLLRFSVHIPLLTGMLLYLAHQFSWVNMESPVQVAVFIVSVFLIYAGTLLITFYKDKRTADRLNNGLKKRYHP